MLGIVTIVSNAVDDLYLYQKSKNTSIREKIEILKKALNNADMEYYRI